MGLENLHGRPLDYKIEETDKESLYKNGNNEEEQEQEKISAFDDDIEDLLRAKKFLEEYRAQENKPFKSDFDKPRTR